MTPILITFVPFIVFTFFWNLMYTKIPDLNEVWDYLELKTKNSQDIIETLHYFIMKLVFHIFIPAIPYSLILLYWKVIINEI